MSDRTQELTVIDVVTVGDYEIHQMSDGRYRLYRIAERCREYIDSANSYEEALARIEAREGEEDLYLHPPSSRGDEDERRLDDDMGGINTTGVPR